MQSVSEFACGPNVETVEPLEVPDSYQIFEELISQGVSREDASRAAHTEYQRVKDLNQRVVKPVNSGMQRLNSNVKKLSILGWAASVGHLGHIWTWCELKKLRATGEQAIKAVPPLVEAMKVMSSGG